MIPLSIVFFEPEEGYEDQYPFKPDTPLLFLGEIPNMPDHCAVVFKGCIFWGFHTDNFRLATEDEL